MTNASDEPDAGRFEVEVGGQAAELVYRVDADLLILVHTEVPSELAGHGVGGRLMRAAIKKATRDGLTIVPLCPFARRWLEGHPEDIDGVPLDWEFGTR